MALVQSSPWMDAANYGAGLGQSLGQMLVQMPAVRAQVAAMLGNQRLEQQRFQLERETTAQRLGLEQQRMGFERERMAYERPRYEADAEEARARAGMYKQQQAQREQQVGMAHQMALQDAAPVAPGYQGPPAPTRQSMMDELLGGASPEALANYELHKKQLEQGKYIAAPWGTLNTASGDATVVEKQFPTALSGQLMSEMLRVSADPMFQDTIKRNPQIGQAYGKLWNYLSQGLGAPGMDAAFQSQGQPPAKGQTATNRQTGEQIVFDGEKWVPLRKQ